MSDSADLELTLGLTYAWARAVGLGFLIERHECQHAGSRAIPQASLSGSCSWFSSVFVTFHTYFVISLCQSFSRSNQVLCQADWFAYVYILLSRTAQCYKLAITPNLSWNAISKTWYWLLLSVTHSPNKGILLRRALNVLLVPPVRIGGGEEAALAVVLLRPAAQTPAAAARHPALAVVSVRSLQSQKIKCQCQKG